MYFIPEDFKKFISSACNRKDFIQNYLNSYGIDCPVISMEGKNHIYVKFPLEQYNPMFRIKTVIAHYDRVEQSPGANDNSAAVYSMLEWAVRLKRMSGFHNIRLIFTDGEELGEDGVNQQGAFALAQLFKKLGITNDEIYVFDCMGRGTVPVICETNFSKGTPKTFLNKMAKLENKIQEIVSSASCGKWFKLPCSYSDNASFIANGIPAVAVTMLPSEEINHYLKENIQPETWQMLHTKNDCFENLTPEAFELTAVILNKLALSKSLI